MITENGGIGALATMMVVTSRSAQPPRLAYYPPVAYEFIEDLPDDLKKRESPLLSLAVAWRERTAELAGRDELTRLHERLRRRWAIDTGMIEGLYSIDRGTTELLVDRGLHADLISHGSSDLPPSEIVAFLHDQAEVYDWLFDFIAQRRDLSRSYMKEMHSLLTRNQTETEAVDQFDVIVRVPLLRGQWKKLPNNPRRPDRTIHEYCPPEHVDAEVDRLIDMHREHCELGIAPEVEAAWLHHRFTQIHPFQDGNGRVARALASLVLIRDERFAFSVAPDQKADYIDALERADGGGLAPLVDLITRQQQREFGQALSVAQALYDEQQIFSAALAKAASRRASRTAAYADVKVCGDEVMTAVEGELLRRRDEFNARMASEGLTDEYHAHVFRPTKAAQRGWYFGQIVESARALGYFADTKSYREWVRLSIANDVDESATVLVIAVSSFGRTFKGVLAAMAFIEIVSSTEDKEQRSGPVLAIEDAFTFGYLDPVDHVTPRAKEWLHGAWLSLLKTWQDNI